MEVAAESVVGGCGCCFGHAEIRDERFVEVAGKAEGPWLAFITPAR
jgi:hypothetical protein